MSADLILNNTILSDEVTKAINSAVSPEEIRAAILAEATKQTDAAAATADAAAAKATADVAAATLAAEAAKSAETFKRIEVIGGHEFTFEAATELELERSINNAFKIAAALRQESTETVPDPAAEAAANVAAAKAEEAKAAARTELELQFKRGEITTAVYLEQSGAMDEYLVSKGLSIAALKETVDRHESAKFEQSWEDATTEFLKGSGSTWPGGARNKEMMGLQIAALGLSDAKDKVAAFSAAFAEMKKKNLVFALTPEEEAALAPQTEAAMAAAAVKAADTLRTNTAEIVAAAAVAAAAVKRNAVSSSLFGASSGTSAAVITAKDANQQKFDVPSNATPEEIMDAWKKGVVAAGQDPNAAFTESFATRRAH